MSEVPKTCKAGVVVKHGQDFKLQVQHVPVPDPGPTEILIRLSATGVCYSDIHYVLEDLPLPRMGDYGVRSPGHEGAGVVVKIGSLVGNWKVGDRAGVKPTWDTCMSCDLCWGRHECHCPEAVPTGLKVLVDSELRPGDWAAFLGAGGGVGHMGVQLAKAMGLRVIGVDAGSDKRKLCMDLGCDKFIDFTKVEYVPEEIMRITGKGVDGVFVTATSPASYAIATKMAAIGGRIMCVGMPASGTAFAGDDPMFLILRNLKVIGTLTGSLKDTHDALGFAARGLLKPVYQTFSIDRLPEAVDLLRQGKVAGRCVVDFNA
ncbi:hypothetical protein FSARC_7857 [Fusarium sarcochroum]|uniref:Enoyl reductase (ER) domain-containing protein n=1 Tax=Fusarium sarcochroum TaxID=1208366 RepID=A0A8H4TUI7_9HYPO|nr:hypothetical protein FSARC_7857 [Fusarium sarcochroum]